MEATDSAEVCRKAEELAAAAGRRFGRFQFSVKEGVVTRVEITDIVHVRDAGGGEEAAERD